MMTPTLDPNTADTITFWVALAIAIATLGVLLGLIALVRVSQLRRELRRQALGASSTVEQSAMWQGQFTPTQASAVFSPAMSSPAMSTETPYLSPQVSLHARQLLATGQKIQAIKLVREETGLGLREAKNLVERL